MIFDGPKAAKWTIALAHGAGAGMETPFMDAVAAGLAKHRIRVARFEFPYMQRRRETGKNRPPDREPVLRQAWLDVVADLGTERLAIGGKSMGGRMASMVADEAGVARLVCLGYPFHPPGRPEKLRTEHLRDIQTPTLIIQGERDTFGKREEVAEYDLASTIRFHWLTDGDHSFKPRKASGITLEHNLDEAVEAIAAFLED